MPRICDTDACSVQPQQVHTSILLDDFQRQGKLDRYLADFTGKSLALQVRHTASNRTNIRSQTHYGFALEATKTR
ncbi:MAG: hypothetical protein ABS36_14110 [Acidobacteria bacterium SCN 69-37]|nr:MAG: hypothetical protein ABS36_14110 [Acidobacteria bacterium SCN 69-37]